VDKEANKPGDSSATPREPPHEKSPVPSRLGGAPREAPREAPNARCPGEYRLAIRISQAEVDPGGEFHLEIFIVGYGEIWGSKLACYPPTYFVDPSKSKALRFMAIGDEDFRWGSDEGPFSADGFSAMMGGPQGAKWEHSDPFFDVLTSPTGKAEFGVSTISTEMRTPQAHPSDKKPEYAAPVSIFVRVQEKVPSGNHSLQFFFTYFNGNEWKVDSQSVDVAVRSWVRRHEGVTAVVGIALAAVALIATVGSLVFQILEYFAS
jgi:hypothetical protein